MDFFVFFGVCLALTLILFVVFGQSNIWSFDQEKFSAYECGFDPFEDTRFNFDIRFYLVAIFFIIFDLEVIFFFPLTLALPFLGFADFLLVVIFVFFLFIGVVYEFWSGKLDWSLGLLNNVLESTF